MGDEDLHHMTNWFECLRSRQQPHATVTTVRALGGLHDGRAVVLAGPAGVLGRKERADPRHQYVGAAESAGGQLLPQLPTARTGSKLPRSGGWELDSGSCTRLFSSLVGVLAVDGTARLISAPPQDGGGGVRVRGASGRLRNRSMSSLVSRPCASPRGASCAASRRRPLVAMARTPGAADEFAPSSIRRVATSVCTARRTA